MILTCQNCSTSFRLDETLLKPTGSKVRCSQCRHTWVAMPPEPASEDRPGSGDDARTAQAAVLGAAVLGAGAAAAGLPEEANEEPPADRPPELKFFMDDDDVDVDQAPSEDEDLVTDEINLDELDQLLSEDSGPLSGPRPDEDFKTEELDLADLEKMLDLESDASQTDAAVESAAEEEEVDLTEVPVDNLEAGTLEKEDSVIEELDLDLEDLEGLLDEDTGLGDEIASVEESSGDLEAAGVDLEEDDAEAAADEIALDMTPELDDLLQEDGGAPAVEETEELGASEMAEVLEESEPPAARASDDDQDFDFELAPGLDGIFDEDEGPDVPIEETEELDFSGLSADLDMAEEGPQEEAEADDLELDLDLGSEPRPRGEEEAEGLAEFELELEADEETQVPGADEADVPELDLSDLSEVLGEEDAAAERAEDAGIESELELDLEMDSGDVPGTEELELDLEEAGVAASAAASGPSEDIPDETRELGSDELESLLESGGAEGDAEEEASSDSLELDIDLEGLEDGDSDALDDATRELDLDDIEKILEMDGSRGEQSAPEMQEASEDLDLDLDMDSVAPPPPPQATGEETGEETTGADDALDLSELERMLDVEDTTDAPATGEEDLDDLDLDFDLQPSTDEGDELDLEFDMMDEEPVEASALFDTSESEDLGLELEGAGAEAPADDLEGDLDFEIIDEDRVVEEVDLDLAAEDIGNETLSDAAVAKPVEKRGGPPHDRDLTQELMDEMAAADTQTMTAPPMESKPIRPAPPHKRKKKSSKGLVLLLILVLLGGAGYLLPKYTDIKLPSMAMPDLSGLPVIGQFFSPASPEAIVPVEASLKGEWVQNQQDGRLYIIEGQVRNAYQKPRSFIRVTGRVYANGRQFQRAATAYGGNVLTPEELATLPLADIQKALSSRSGMDNRNVKVAPGAVIPFQVVFGDLPPDVELQEFAVEISGSLPVAGD